MNIELLFKKLFYAIFRIIFRNKNRKSPLNLDEVTNVLVLRYDAIGDMIVTLPTIRMLKELLPKSNIDIIASTRNISIVESEPIVRYKYIQPHGFFKSLIQGVRLRKNNYDLVLSLVLNDTTKAGLIANLAGTQNTVKAVIENHKRRDIYSALFNKQIPLQEYRKKITMLELQCKFVAEIFGLKSYEHLIRNTMNINKEDSQFALVKTKGLTPFIVYNISSGDDYRTFSIEKNVTIIGSIINELKEFSIIIIFAPNEQSKAEKIRDKVNNKRVLVLDSMSLTEVAAIINLSSIVFTPDTSIVHIASAMQRPVFLIYSLLSSHVEEWLPYKTKFDYVRTKTKGPIENIETEEIINGFLNFVKEGM